MRLAFARLIIVPACFPAKNVQVPFAREPGLRLAAEVDDARIHQRVVQLDHDKNTRDVLRQRSVWSWQIPLIYPPPLSNGGGRIIIKTFACRLVFLRFSRRRLFGRFLAADGPARRPRFAGRLGGDVHVPRRIHRTVLRIVRARFPARAHQRRPVLAVRPVQLSRSRLDLRRGHR